MVELFVPVAALGVVIWLLSLLLGALKPKKASNEVITPPEGPRIVGPDDLVIPAALLAQWKRDELLAQLHKKAARGAPSDTRGPVGGAEDDSGEQATVEH